jgi:hypothetical protein
MDGYYIYTYLKLDSLFNSQLHTDNLHSKFEYILSLFVWTIWQLNCSISSPGVEYSEHPINLQGLGIVLDLGFLLFYSKKSTMIWQQRSAHYAPPTLG